MAWTLNSSIILSIASNVIILPTVFTTTDLVVVVTPESVKPNWRFFGDLEQITTLPSPLGQVRISSQRLRLGATLLRFANDYPYELKFTCFHWLPVVAIEVYLDV